MVSEVLSFLKFCEVCVLTAHSVSALNPHATSLLLTCTMQCHSSECTYEISGTPLGTLYQVQLPLPEGQCCY